MDPHSDSSDDIVVYDRNEASPRIDDVEQDVGIFDNVCISIPNHKVSGVLCLFLKRRQLFLSYIPIDIRANASIKQLIKPTKTKVQLQDYKYTINMRDVLGFFLTKGKQLGTTQLVHLTFELDSMLPFKLPTFEFNVTQHNKDVVRLFVDSLNHPTLLVTHDDPRRGHFTVTHPIEKAKAATLIQEYAYLRFNDAAAKARRKAFLQRHHLDQLTPVTKTMLQSAMNPDGFLSTTALNDLRKVMFYQGCSDDVRPFMWRLCLGYYEGKNTQKERLELDTQRETEYEQIKATWKNVIPEMKQNWAEFLKTEEQIKKDVQRTDCEDTAFWRDEKNPQMLFDVLMSAFMYNVDMGYGQGMNDIAVCLMRVTRNEAEVFWLFQSVMTMLNGFYSSKPNVVLDLLNRLGLVVENFAPKLSLYLKEKQINYLFLYKTVVLLFKRFIQDKDILRFWDAMFAFPESKFYYFVSAALVQEFAEDIVENQMDFDQLYVLFQGMSNKVPVEIIYDADELLQAFTQTNPDPEKVTQLFRPDRA